MQLVILGGCHCFSNKNDQFRLYCFITGATGSGSSSGKGSDDGKGAGPPVFLCPNCGDTTPLEQFLSKLITLF